MSRRVPLKKTLQTNRISTLNTPGGPRMKGEDVRHLYRVSKANNLTTIDKGNRFLMNMMLTHTMVQKIGPEVTGKLLIEYGPGPGTLTRSLLTRPCFGVLGLEVDPRYNVYLEGIQQSTQHKFRWKNANVMEEDAGALALEMFPEMKKLMTSSSWESPPLAYVFANLPFAMTGPLIVKHLKDMYAREGVYRFGRVPLKILMQQELGERIIATPNTQNFGALTVLCQNYCKCHVERVLIEESFYPYPEVTAALVS
eukprot:PhF_6_TR22277/c0_g1_i3/m.31510/K15266/TFB1M; dimethyladenosine transferase 1, mitochondrial